MFTDENAQGFVNALEAKSVKMVIGDQIDTWNLED